MIANRCLFSTIQRSTNQASLLVASVNNTQVRIIATAPTTSANKRKQTANGSQAANGSSRTRLVEYLENPEVKSKLAPTSTGQLFDHFTNKELKYYDPPYLIREAPFPKYELLNINLKGYDHVPLEHFFNHVIKMCNVFKVNIVDTYPMPARSFQIKTYQPFSSILDKNYSLKMYQRVIRVKDLKSTVAPILFESIQLNLPEGIQLSVSKPTVEEDDFRYVPDIELQELKAKLEELKATKNVPATTTPVKK